MSDSRSNTDQAEPLEEVETAAPNDTDKVIDVEPEPAGRGFLATVKRWTIIILALAVLGAGAYGSYPFWRAEIVAPLAQLGLEPPVTNLPWDRGLAPAKSETTSNQPAPTQPAQTAPPVPARIEPVSANDPRVDELAERIAGLEANAAEITTTLGAIQGELQRVSTLETRLGELAGTLTGMIERIDAAAGRVDGLAGQVEALAARPVVEVTPESGLDKAEIDAAIAAGIESAVAARLAETKQPEIGPEIERRVDDRLSTVRDEIANLLERLGQLEGQSNTGATEVAELKRQADALRQAADQAGNELSALSTQVGTLSSSLAESGSADTRTALLAVAISRLGAQASGPEPYANQLAAVRALEASAPEIAEALTVLEQHAATGIPTRQQLSDRFPPVATAALRASLVGADDSFLGQTLARITNLVTVRKVESDGRNTTADILAETEQAFDRGDLVASVASLKRLTGDPATVAGDWLMAAEARLAADQAVERLNSAALKGLAVGG